MKFSEVIFESSMPTLLGIHFSQQAGLTELTPQFWNTGTGIPGAERARADQYPEWFVKDRTYFYLAGSGFVKEAGLGSHKYQSHLQGVYDWDNDPDNIASQAKALAHQDYVDGQNRLHKLMGILDPFDGNSNEYDRGLMLTMMENLVSKKYNGYYSASSNHSIVYFKPVACQEIS